MTIYYKVIIKWQKYPMNDCIDKKYCLFSYSKRKFKAIEGLEMDSNTSIQEKIDYLKLKLKVRKIQIEKIK
ncbi:hypothetical protein CLV99_0975 [Sphingobacterium yanglingense]|uniref:Uncharacterized protein n=1 Tax=Sphingobacterium yanglingense TaxID=1437280 RepID=A0A4R6WH84_9SPHI|nr:hypothetical protein CLV99_0975 [Sphingobacterium yanglingense]